MTTDELVDEIFGRCRERIERGEAVDVEATLRAHPDLAEALRERFATAQLLDRAGAHRRARGADVVAASRVGAALGPYRIESLLGAGGMGTVYLARVEGDVLGVTAALSPGARVALKVFHPHLVARERFVERFVREAALGRRVGHENVVRTLDADEAVEAGQTVRFLVMEHVEGRTLRDLLSELGCLPEELCRHVGREVAKGLAAIHAAGAVHRDLKPENVIVTKDHAVKVMDLGVAHVEDVDTLSETGAFIGSLRYGAPEQFRSQGRIDHRVDLHALGLVLFELATGKRAFDGEEFHEVVRQILDVRPRSCGELMPQVSPFLEELVAQLLEKDRERRPPSAEAVALILDEGEASAWWRERAVAIRRETRRPLRRIRIPRETSLYGRDAELTTLRARFDQARAGDGQVVLVEGEAGIGKSRLVDEFVSSLWTAGEDVDFLVGSYPPGGAATATGAFSTAYRAHLGDDEDAIRDALPETPLLVPAFAALLRGDVSPAGAVTLTKDSLQTLFVHATRSFAAKRTTIVFIDDLHFAPEEGRALFTSLALAAPGHRILLVGGARPSLDGKWAASVARLPQVSRLPLARLSPRDLIELLDDALHSRHLAEELGGKIAAKSDVNPFFVFEILRGLREGRFLTKKPDGTWITTRAIREIEVPPSIVEVIEARVSDLGADERNVLEVASAIGFDFDAALVGAVLRVEAIPLLQRLGQIEKAHRLVRSVGHRFMFDHHQVQEVLYAGLSAPLREAYHASIAEAIETQSGAASREPNDLDGAVCVDLAEHFLRGMRGGRALRYLDHALTHLETHWLNDAAVSLCDRALAVPGLLAGRARCELDLRKGARLRRLGQMDAARAAFDEALVLADETGDPALRAKARTWLGNYLNAVSRNDDAQRTLEEALAICREAGDREGEANAISQLGALCYDQSRFGEALTLVERHLALSLELGDRLGEARATGNRGAILGALGRHDESRVCQERRLALSRELGDRLGEANAIGNLGVLLHSLGRHDEARAHQERRLALSRELGERRGEAHAIGSVGAILQSLGRFDEARTCHEQSLALVREIGDRWSEAHETQRLGEVLLAQGRIDEALASFERQLVLVRDTGDRWGEVGALVSLGVTLARALGSFAEAREHLDRSLSLSRTIGARAQESWTLCELAGLAAAEGSADAAELGFAAALAAHEAMGAREHEARTRVDWGSFLARQGRRDEARSELERALATARRHPSPGLELLAAAWLAWLPSGDTGPALAALVANEERAPMLDTLEARFLLWEATRDRAHLGEAKRLLDFLVEHAPAESRESMLANVRLHREIVAAWREASPDDAAARKD